MTTPPLSENTRRSILLAARVRFSPSGASIRNQAIERIIEQNLAAADSVEGLTEQELREVLTLRGQSVTLRGHDLLEGLRRLRQSDRIQAQETSGSPRYSLNDDAKNHILQLLQESDRRITTTVAQLFDNAPGGWEQYYQPFVEVLCLVFSKLTDVYVQVITMKMAASEFLEHRVLFAAIDQVLDDNPTLDESAFRYGTARFFQESTPDFDAIKWNMAQNFYVAKALGVSDGADLLSTEIFSGSSFYFDTNVLIAGLAPGTRHHESFRELSRGCASIGVNLRAARITLSELKNVITAYATLLKQVSNKIPVETQSKVHNFLLESFLHEKALIPELSIDDFINRFGAPIDTLSESFGVSQIDDDWFDQAINQEGIKQLSSSLSAKYKMLRGKPKSPSAALHDALLLEWVKKENQEDRRTWIVTLDVTLADWSATKKQTGSNVVTLDALLQWMPPVLAGSANEDRLSEIFSEALRYQLLPRDTFFQLRDFQVFAEMGIETRQLPAEDVEACILELRKHAPQLDPSKAEHREKIGQVIQRYFADPGAKYQRNLRQLQRQLDSLTESLQDAESKKVAAEEKVSDLETKVKELEQKHKDEATARSSAESRLREMEQWVSNEEASKRARKLKWSALRRIAFTLLLLAIVEGGILYLSWKYAEGDNLFQRLTSSWRWLAAGFAGVAIVFPFIMGGDRMRLLRFWKGEAS
jgi:hypothetical protein